MLRKTMIVYYYKNVELLHDKHQQNNVTVKDKTVKKKEFR
jgi:hypothetical protein